MSHIGQYVQKSIMHQRMETRKCTGKKEEIREEKCQKAEPQAASSSPPGIRQRVWVCVYEPPCVSACLWEKRSTFPPTQSHDSAESAPGVGLREREKERQRKSSFSEKATERGETWRRERENRAKQMQREHLFIHSSTLFCNAPFSCCFEDAGLMGRGWGEVGRVEVVVLLMAWLLGIFWVLYKSQCVQFTAFCRIMAINFHCWVIWWWKGFFK